MQVTIWAVLMIAFLVVEGATAALASIWFAIGALAALVCALIVPDILWLQISVFVIVSLITLILTRPIAKKHLNLKVEATNADRCIGKVAEVTEEINNIKGTGRAEVSGRDWTARAKDGEIIEIGSQVIIEAIEGAKLIVKVKEEIKIK